MVTGSARTSIRATLPRFLLVGVANTALSAAIMFLLYNLAHAGYWPSTAVSYVAGAVFSFFANRSFTFADRGSPLRSAWKFALVIAVCYAIAFTVARPACRWVLGGLGASPVLIDNAAMAVGMVVFTGLNFLGQRFFVFPRRAPDTGSDQLPGVSTPDAKASLLNRLGVATEDAPSSGQPRVEP